jgi:hypothetical protein
MEYYTSFIDNSWFLCVRLDSKIKAEEEAAKLAEAANEEDI